MRYVAKLDKDPKASLMKDLPQEGFAVAAEIEKFSKPHIAVILIFILAMALLTYGAGSLGWYIDEICALFLCMGLLSAIVVRMSMARIVQHFTDGAKGMLGAALIIAISRSVLVVTEDGKIIDTLLFYMASAVGDLPRSLSVQGMFIVQGLLNILVPSGSGQAAITMPIMTPLSDLLGISRQTAVLAFQFGDGLLNMVIPTSGVTMGILSIAKIPTNFPAIFYLDNVHLNQFGFKAHATYLNSELKKRCWW